jgi:Sigma-70, region 4
MLPTLTRTGGWSPLAKSDRRWCGFREVGLVFSTPDRDPALLARGGRGGPAALEPGHLAPEYLPSSGTEESWVPTIAQIETIERSGSQKTGVGDRKRAQPVSSEMRDAGETHDARRVREALASIPKEQRTALELAYWGGLSPTEIGMRTGAPVESVTKCLELALLKLGDLLAKE